MKLCSCTVNNNTNKNGNVSTTKPTSEKQVQFLRTSFCYKVLASLKLLQSSKKCRGIHFSDIVKFVSSKYPLTGDIESQVQNAITTAMCSNFLIKRGDRYFVVPPAASIHTAHPDAKKEQLTRIDTIFNYCRKVQFPPTKCRSRSRSRSRSRCRTKSRSRSRSRSPRRRRSISPGPSCSTRRCPGTKSITPSLENLKNKILSRRCQKLQRRQNAKYSLRSLDKKSPATDLCKSQTRSCSKSNTSGCKPVVSSCDESNNCADEDSVVSYDSTSTSSFPCYNV